MGSYDNSSKFILMIGLIIISLILRELVWFNSIR